MTEPEYDAHLQPGLPDRPAREAASWDTPFLDENALAGLIIKRTPFPGVMLAAGIFWILAGLAYLGLFGLLRFGQVPLRGSDFWMIFCALFFFKDGIQLLRGRFGDPLSHGIWTILIGVIFVGEAAIRFVHSANPLALIFGVILGGLFLIPGILVLMGRKHYLAWRGEQGLDPG